MPNITWHDQVFFGLHFDLHAGVGDHDLGRSLTHEHLNAMLTRINPDWVQCDCKGHAGYTSWPTKVGSTSPGVVKDSLRIYRDVTKELGMPLVMHYSGVWDARAVELHPEWRSIKSDGTPSGMTCNLSAYIDELMIPQMIELIDNYDVDGFWVDGDMWACLHCYCDKCKAEFTRRTGIPEYPTADSEPNWGMWSDFHRTIFVEHVRKYTDAVHMRKPGCTVCSNWIYTVGHPDAVSVDVDYLSGDFAHVWGTEASSIEGRFISSRHMSWDLMAWGFTTAENKMSGWTFKTAAHLCQEISSIMALSGAVSIYDQPQRCGYHTDWHTDILADVARFARTRQDWCQGTTSVPQAVIVHCPEHLYAGSPNMLMPVFGEVRDPLLGALHALLENHVSVDIVRPDDLMDTLCDYKLVVIPEQTKLSDRFKTALRMYVQQGGKVIATGVSVSSDMAELAGVMADGEPHDGYFYLQVGREATVLKGPYQPVSLTTGQCVKKVMNENQPGLNETAIPAITINSVGEGEFLAIHCPVLTHYRTTHYPRTRQLIGEVLHLMNPGFTVDAAAPARLYLVLRQKPGYLIIHLLNNGTTHPMSPSQVMVEDVPPVGPVSLTVKCLLPPKAVTLRPGCEGLVWSWREGNLTVDIQSVGIFDSVVIALNE
ncbi:MAG: beta-galactosidase trimerization domain-containing protein [Armatimonadota bacterium]